MTPFKTKLHREALVSLQQVIVKVLDSEMETDDDKLLAANLAAIHDKVERKLLDYKERYNIKLMPAEAIAIRMLYTSYINDATTYLGNQLHRLSNQIHQQYQ